MRGIVWGIFLGALSVGLAACHDSSPEWSPGDPLNSPGNPPVVDPTQPGRPPAPPVPPPPGSDLLLKVQVFPHLGRYSTPQGRETAYASVTLASDGNCVLSAMSEAGAEAPEAQGSTFKFSTQTLTGVKKLRCESPVTVRRESGLTSLKYRGAFEISRGKNGNAAFVRVVNLVSLEDYLKGVVPSEMPSTWSDEALRAQAIAARSYAVNQTQAEPIIDDTIQYQAYLGVTQEQPSSNAAVAATRGKVLAFGGGVIVAYFSADSGGRTESARDGMDVSDAPYCEAKAEAYNLEDGPPAWSASVDVADLAPRIEPALALGLPLPGAEERADWREFTDTLRAKTLVSAGVDETSRTDGGRARFLLFRYSDGTVTKLRAKTFASASRLKSTYFSTRLSGDGRSIEVQGRGFGHGVGMSQWGAQILSTALGWDATKILAFYYAGTRTCSIGDAASGCWNHSRSETLPRR